MADELRVPPMASLTVLPRDDWAPLVTRATKLSDRVVNGPVSQREVEDARKLALSDHFDQALNLGLGNRMVRGILGLWAGDAQISKTTLKLARLQLMLPASAKLSRLAVLALTRLYFNHFDLLDEWSSGAFSFVRKRLSKQAADCSSHSRTKNLTSYFADHQQWCTDMDGPKQVATEIRRDELRLDDFLSRHGIGELRSSRYVQIIRHTVYLERIKASDPREFHGFLRDFTETGSTALLQSRAPDGRWFGHQVLEAMANPRASKPHPSWLKTVLDIAGDPRTAFTAKWQQWWQAVGDDYRRTVVRWLSGDDLKLFLDAVQEQAKFDPVQSRMLPARKRFLEGLYELGLIQETRLLAGTQMRMGIKESIGNNLTTTISHIQKDTHLAAISVDCGDFHIVEGSYNFKIHVYTAGSPDKLTDWSQPTFERFDLATGIPVNYATEFGWDTVESIIHYPQSWLYRTLQYLGNRGISVDPEAVMTTEDYEEMITRSDQGPIYVAQSQNRRR